MNARLRADLRATLPGTNEETWKGGVITQPFLKEENDNNCRKASHRKQPCWCMSNQSICFCLGDVLGLVQRKACSVPCVPGNAKVGGNQRLFSPWCFLNKSAASQRNTGRARGLQERVSGTCVGCGSLAVPGQSLSQPRDFGLQA